MVEYIKFPNPYFNGFENCEVSEDNPDELLVRAKYEVCPTCRGKGTHVNRAIDGNGLSAEDFAEDPDFFEDYMSGMYDVQCEECKGQRVVLAPDIGYMEAHDPAILKLYYEYLKEKEYDDSIYRAEMDYCYGRGRW